MTLKKEHVEILMTVIATVIVSPAVYFLSGKSEMITTNIITICIFLFSLIKQNEAIKEQKILGAWQVLSTKAVGNSGKKEALEFLARHNVDLVGIDLSAKSNGGTWNEGEKRWENGVYLRGLNLGGLKANLAEANFEGACLGGANFEGANLERVNFSCANFECKKRGLISYKGPNFKEANLREARFSGARFESVDFEKSCLVGANFKDSYFLRLVQFRLNSNFKQEAADFLDADFTGATFYEGADFEGVRFGRSNFSNANLENVNFKNSELGGSIFTKANLSKSDFTGAKIIINFEGQFADAYVIPFLDPSHYSSIEEERCLVPVLPKSASQNDGFKFEFERDANGVPQNNADGKTAKYLIKFEPF